MKQLILSVLLKLKKKYPEDKAILRLLSDYPDWDKSVKWIEKSGALDKSVEELYNRLKTDVQEELLLKLFSELYPRGVVSKHPDKRVWLLKLGEHKFFYEVGDKIVLMPVVNDEPREFSAAKFFANLPKLEEFIQYLTTYSMRRRRGFKFSH